MDDLTAEELKLAFQDFESDPEMSVCVLHGIGGSFSAGYDLEELAALEEDLPNKVYRRETAAGVRIASTVLL